MDKVAKISLEQKRYILAELNRYTNWSSKPEPRPLKKTPQVLAAESLQRKAKRVLNAHERREADRKKKFEKAISSEVAKVRREALFGTPESALTMLNELNRKFPLKG